jgi:hypothetical protein
LLKGAERLKVGYLADEKIKEPRRREKVNVWRLKEREKSVGVAVGSRREGI